jgi:Protein of unknown function (DUF3455)
MHVRTMIAVALSGMVLSLQTVPALAADTVDTTAPAALQPPSGSVLRAKFAARGVQIYKCQGTEWKLQGPDAQLFDSSGKQQAKHYAGPTWEAGDGSSVVGEPTAHVDSPDGQGVAWLLLRARSNTGQGLFGSVRSIQRLHTVGGKPPSSACAAANAEQIERVNYTADYYFFTEG